MIDHQFLFFPLNSQTKPISTRDHRPFEEHNTCAAERRWYRSSDLAIWGVEVLVLWVGLPSGKIGILWLCFSDLMVI